MPAIEQTHDGNESKRQNLIFLSFILSGLRFDRELIADMYRRLNMLMQESTTYQGILEEGIEKGERKLIIRQGTLKFGPPSEQALSRLNSISIAGQLESLGEKLLTVSSWDELFACD